MEPIPPAATDPTTAACEIDVLFMPRGSDQRRITDPPQEDEHRFTLVTAGVPDMETVRHRAYARMRQRINVDTDEDVDAAYEMGSPKFSFYDPPWETTAELEKKLGSFEEVQTVRYYPPTPEVYLPPHFVLTVDAGQEENVADAVTDYYPGLTASPGMRRVAVISCPIRNPEQYSLV